MRKQLIEVGQQVQVVPPPMSVQQRRGSRIEEPCYLTYSGISADVIVVGEGTALDYSADGFGIEGSRAVVPGALLTLCVCIPDGQEPLLVEEVRVAWVQGKRFGVSAVQIGHEERRRLSRYVARHQARGKKKTATPLSFALPLEQVAS